MPGEGRRRGIPSLQRPSPPHSPSSTAATVLSRRQFFLRKLGQLHPFLPAFAIAGGDGPGALHAVQSRAEPIPLPPCVRSALLRAYSGEAETLHLTWQRESPALRPPLGLPAPLPTPRNVLIFPAPLRPAAGPRGEPRLPVSSLLVGISPRSPGARPGQGKGQHPSRTRLPQDRCPERFTSQPPAAPAAGQGEGEKEQRCPVALPKAGSLQQRGEVPCPKRTALACIPAPSRFMPRSGLK